MMAIPKGIFWIGLKLVPTEVPEWIDHYNKVNAVIHLLE